MSLAAKVLEEMEKNAELRRKLFRILLADLMLDPDLRMAMVNAMIREVATKSDLSETEKRIITSIDDLGKSMNSHLENIPTKDSIKDLTSKVEEVARDIKEFKNMIGVIESVGERFNKVEDKVDTVKNVIEIFEATFSNITSKLDDSLSKIGATTTSIQETITVIQDRTSTIENRTFSIENRISRLTVTIFIILLLTLVTLVVQLLETLKLIP
jgi:methyl-accepting chemotaxis protein